MAFAPRLLPSGRYQGGFKHPVTKRHITQTFDYEWQAEAFGVDEERKARQRMMSDGETATIAAPAPAVPAVWEGPTIADYGREYLDRRAGLLARKTRNKYASFLTGLSAPVGKTGDLTARRMGTLKKSEVEQWITDSINAEVGRPTINGRIALLRQLYADLLAEGETPIQRDPTHGIKKLVEEIDDDRILTPREEPGLLDVAGDQLRLAMLVALDAGLRWQEVHALRPQSLLGGPDGTDYISVTQVVDGRELRGYPKGKRKRVVPTTDRLSAALAAAIDGMPANQLLFTAADGGLVGYDNWRKRVWAPTMYRAGLGRRIEVPANRTNKHGQPVMQARYEAEFGFHALRHTYGSRLADKGVPRSQIAVLMGHANERTTSRYIHKGDDGRRLALVRDVLTAA